MDKDDNDNISSIGAVTGGGFFGGLLIGYALKESSQTNSCSSRIIHCRIGISTISTNSFFNWEDSEGTI